MKIHYGQPADEIVNPNTAPSSPTPASEPAKESSEVDTPKEGA